MRDGQTRKLKTSAIRVRIKDFLVRFQAKIVVVSGAAAGQEFLLDRQRLTLGRGPNVDVVLDDAAMSRQHAAIEYAGAGFRILDLGSTNGVLLNDEPVQAGEIGHGDRFQIGNQRFQLVIEKREDVSETYELPSET